VSAAGKRVQRSSTVPRTGATARPEHDAGWIPARAAAELADMLENAYDALDGQAPEPVNSAEIASMPA